MYLPREMGDEQSDARKRRSGADLKWIIFHRRWVIRSVMRLEIDMVNRVKCEQCDNMILEQTAHANGGLCAPCFKGENQSVSPYELKLEIPADQLDDKHKRDQLAGAIYWGNESRIDELLSGDAGFLSVPPTEFHTWLGEAISRNCRLLTLEKMVAAGCDTNSRASSPDQTSALEVAVSKDRIDAVEWLLENGADPNVGRPIIGAVHYEKPPETQMTMLIQLLDAGADINKTFALNGDENNRFTVLDWAILYEISPEVIKFLERRSAKRLNAFE